MKLWPFKVIAGPGDKPMIVVTYKGEEKQFSAEEISSMVLTKIRRSLRLTLELQLRMQLSQSLLTSMTRSDKQLRMLVSFLALM